MPADDFDPAAIAARIRGHVPPVDPTTGTDGRPLVTGNGEPYYASTDDPRDHEEVNRLVARIRRDRP